MMDAPPSIILKSINAKQTGELWIQLQYILIGLDKENQRKIVNIFLPISFSLCFGGSKEPSH